MLRRRAHDQGTRGVGLDLADRLGAAFSVGRVYGEPVQRDDTTVVPVATVRAAAFGGAAGLGLRGGGSAFVAEARPLGVVVLRRGSARFRAVVDVNRLFLIAPVLAAIAALAAVTVVAVSQTRRRRREHLAAVPDRR